MKECSICDGMKRICIGHYPKFDVRKMEVTAGEIYTPCKACNGTGSVEENTNE